MRVGKVNYLLNLDTPPQPSPLGAGGNKKGEGEARVAFGYSHPLKTLWQKGKLPTVKRGLYGGVLTKDTVSLEHITPVSEGGKTVLDNLALATKENNNMRGNKDIGKFLTFGMIRDYLKQFQGIKVDGFDGAQYIMQLRRRFNELLE